jgi:kanamycin kinase
VRRRHHDWRIELAWSSVPETATWRLRREGRSRYLKVARAGWEPTLTDERARLEWAAGRVSVPRVVDHGREGDREWLLLDGLPGLDATRVESPDGPEALVRILARGLRRLHEIPAHDCPFRFRLDDALAHIRRRAAAGLIEPARHFHPEHRHLTLSQAVAELEASRPDSEDVVLCHGDYCFPNVLIDAGRVSGYVDVGELGLADRWWDLAVATWSVAWNAGAEWEEAFLEAYGVDREPDRIRYYRLLYDLAS